MYKLRIFVTSSLLIAGGAAGALGCGGGPGGKVPVSTPIWQFQQPEAEDVFADDDFADDVEEPEAAPPPAAAKPAAPKPTAAAGGAAQGDAK